jgi:hypothetical protein
LTENIWATQIHRRLVKQAAIGCFQPSAALQRDDCCKDYDRAFHRLLSDQSADFVEVALAQHAAVLIENLILAV